MRGASLKTVLLAMSVLVPVCALAQAPTYGISAAESSPSVWPQPVRAVTVRIGN